MGWLVTAVILFLLAILPLGVSVIYNADGPLVRVIAGPVRITLFPRPKKVKKEKNKPEKKPTGEHKNETENVEPKNPPEVEKAKPVQKKDLPPAEQEQTPPPPEPRRSVAPETEQNRKPSGGSWTDFLPLVKVGLNFLGDFRRKLRVDVLNLKLIMAGGDPCNLAINYGRTWAAVGNLMPQLERFLIIKKRNVEVECDFTASETLVDARLDISITLGRLLALVVCYAIRVLKEYLAIQKKRKGGATT